MAFMQLELTEKMRGLCVDGNCGIDYLPCNIADIDASIGRIYSPEDEDYASACAVVRDYTENTRIDSIEVVYGHFGRYQAPGYLDCTPWSFDTDPDALAAELDEYYGDDECGNPADECTCNADD